MCESLRLGSSWKEQVASKCGLARTLGPTASRGGHELQQLHTGSIWGSPACWMITPLGNQREYTLGFLAETHASYGQPMSMACTIRIGAAPIRLHQTSLWR